MTDTTQNPLELSDDAFLNATPPAVVETPADQGAADDANQDTTGSEADGGEGQQEDLNKGEEGDKTPSGTEQQDEGLEGDKSSEDKADPAGGVAEGQGTGADAEKTDDEKAAVEAAKGEQDPSKKTAEPAVEAATPVNYEEQYNLIMKPFKANGKEIVLKSPEEAVRLMQMGANFTRKMQDLQPHRKVLRMLESNQLLDEDRLSYLIDLDKKNPEAIKKLIKESGIDPHEIDVTEDVNYRAGAHRIGDDEDRFKTALEDVTSSDEGKQTVQIIHNTWDESSKEFLWKNPETLTLINQQRENGIYDRIATEMDRQKTLGVIPIGTPFLEAYRQVGDQLAASNGFQDLAQKTDTPTANPTEAQGEKQVVARRAAAPKTPVANDDKARAAGASRSSSQAAKPLVNPLAMSDEDFLKLPQNV